MTEAVCTSDKITDSEINALTNEEFSKDEESEELSFVSKVLHTVPFIVPFTSRVVLFKKFLKESWSGHFESGMDSAFRIRRGHVFQDAFSQMNGRSIDWKDRLKVTFVDELGMEEVGIDGGGTLYKL